jgi:hypothetical protein
MTKRRQPSQVLEVLTPDDVALHQLLQRPSAEWPARMQPKLRMGKARKIPGTGPRGGGIAITLSINVKKFFEFYRVWKAAKDRGACHVSTPKNVTGTSERAQLSAHVEDQDAPPETDR